MSIPQDKATETAHLERRESDDLEKIGKNGLVADAAAAEYVDPTVTISPEENKRLRKLIYKNLLPIMCVAYVTQSLDKGTLGTSAIMGWQTHVGAVGQDYALTSTMLWLGIIVGEPILNQLVRKLPVAKVLGVSMIVWTALVFGLAFALSIPPVFAIRFLLGFFESSFGPCLVAITVQWFTAPEQVLITTVWQAMFGIAGVISNLLAYGFYHIQGRNPLWSWQYMTLTIAVISAAATVIVLWKLPDTPTQVKWASEEDKVKLVERVRANDQGITGAKVWRKEQAREAWTDPFSYMLFFMMFIQSLVVGGLNTFNSILINQAFGFDVLTALLVSIPLSVCQICLYFLIGWLGTKLKQTIYVMVGFTCVNIVGTIVLITVAPNSTSRGGLLVAFYCMQSFQAVNPSMYAMLSRNVAGSTKKSIVYAMFFVGWAGGNAVGPQIFQKVWETRYFNSLYIHLGLYGTFIILILSMRLLLSTRNRKRDRALAETGGENRHQMAFEDLSDGQNSEFRYSY